MQIVISTFYKFINLPDFAAMKQPLLDFGIEHGLRGTILLAPEGINTSISGPRAEIDALYAELRDRYSIELNNIKESFSNEWPFKKMKLRLKKEIVRLDLPEVSGANAGHYVKPEQWDEFIARDDVVVIDTRNDYEVEIGSFTGAINPMTSFFREFPRWFAEHKEEFKGKKIAMFCTGGVRCEKSTAFLKMQDIDEAYHLEGGILGYLEKFGQTTKSWHGDCFVFDDRIAVDLSLHRRP